jgi:hypothetical protein
VQIAPDRLLVFRKPRDSLVDPYQLLGWSEAIRAALGDSFAHLCLETGDTDHEEFVEVVGGDRKKPDALKGRMPRIDRFLQHPAIEVQPGKFPIDEAFGTAADRRRSAINGVFFFCSNSLGGFHEASIHFISNRGGIARTI